MERPPSGYPNYHNENLKFCTWRGFPVLCLNIQIPLNCSSMLKMKAAGSSEQQDFMMPQDHTSHPNSSIAVLTHAIREAR